MYVATFDTCPHHVYISMHIRDFHLYGKLMGDYNNNDTKFCQNST